MLIDAMLGNLSIEQVIAYALSCIAVIFITLPIHEWAHGFAASKLGDPTAKFSGRLTLNPFAHIDYVGALMILLFGFGWAKPVPVNPRYFANRKLGMAITAFAGPISNLLVSQLSLFIAYGLYYFAGSGIIVAVLALFFSSLATINISLAVFNLIPIPPLDGSKILNAILPDRIYYKIMQYERYFFIIIILLISTKLLSAPLTALTSGIYNIQCVIAKAPIQLLNILFL